MIIYRAYNTANKKSYIGQTIYPLPKRIGEHKSYSKNLPYIFYKSIRKYGWESFIWEVICECDTKEELDEMEFHYIKQYHSHISDNGYNMTTGGSSGMHGLTHTEETKQKISVSKTGKKMPAFTDLHKERLRLSNKGKRHPPISKEHKESIRNASKGKMLDPSKTKKCVMISPDWVEYCGFSIHSLSCHLGLPPASMRRVANGERTQHKGWIACYI